MAHAGNAISDASSRPEASPQLPLGEYKLDLANLRPTDPENRGDLLQLFSYLIDSSTQISEAKKAIDYLESRHPGTVDDLLTFYLGHLDSTAPQNSISTLLSLSFLSVATLTQIVDRTPATALQFPNADRELKSTGLEGIDVDTSDPHFHSAAKLNVALGYLDRIAAIIPNAPQKLLEYYRFNPNFDPKVLATLVAHGANVNLPDHDGHTPLQRYTFTLIPERVTALLNLGAEVNAKAPGGYTVLWWAMTSEMGTGLTNPNPAIVHCYLANRDKINRVETFRALLEAKADPNVRLKNPPPQKKLLMNPCS